MTTSPGLIPGYYPPSRENYETLLFLWTLYPLLSSLQWLTPWYPMGKTSITSRLNLPGRIGWMTMEAPGFLTLLYTMRTLSPSSGLPWQNQVLAGLFVIHYCYRAILFPLIQPSMSPLHIGVWLAALTFQVCNGLCIGSWLAAYGPISTEDWDTSKVGTGQFAVGIAVFYVGLAANYFHDDELREIRRREMARQERVAKEQGGMGKGGKKTIEKHYEIPTAGLFKYMLYPHYFVEWVEWFGFWMAAGWGCAPARCFFVNEVTAMLPRAVRGKRWYVERFGEEKVGRKWAVIPGVI
ncbi:hypothetical protein QBC47DRAFT_25038 [Echria macrotheca]|uniref:3-oxo-5-alpha-steroid 4-dehydrogenase C-terminal domain-containing protein n=1 Tax=Echria macrotheca TaxID=438768 RepID=A0AAJ0FGP7_9PEZI|nr:hypothetical protein QBC47DRAFT_25038 [Echria macrotheca]